MKPHSCFLHDHLTVAEHHEWANQLYASYSQGREARLMAAVVGEAGLSDGDRRALAFADRFERELVGQNGRRTLTETIATGWSPSRVAPAPELLLDAANRETLLGHLGEELLRTSRQVNSLERRLQPALSAGLATIRQTLDEREREDHVRLERRMRRRPVDR